MTQSPWEAFPQQIPLTSNPKPAETTTGGKAIVFTVYHKPMGAPRMTQRDKWALRPCVVAYRAFKDAIREAAPELPRPEDIESVSWVAYFVPPRSKASRLGKIHRMKPDRDNIDKAVLDALFKQDQTIGDGRITKRWGVEAKLVVTILLC